MTAAPIIHAALQDSGQNQTPNHTWFSTLYATSTTVKFAVARQSLPGSTLILRLVMAFSTHTKRSVDSKQQMEDARDRRLHTGTRTQHSERL